MPAIYYLLKKHNILCPVLNTGYNYLLFRLLFIFLTDEQIGRYRLELVSGSEKMLFSLADLAEIPHKGEVILGNYHWFNYLLINTDGSRFTFLHRWRKEITDRQKMADSCILLIFRGYCKLVNHFHPWAILLNSKE